MRPQKHEQLTAFFIPVYSLQIKEDSKHPNLILLESEAHNQGINTKNIKEYLLLTHSKQMASNMGKPDIHDTIWLVEYYIPLMTHARYMVEDNYRNHQMSKRNNGYMMESNTNINNEF